MVDLDLDSAQRDLDQLIVEPVRKGNAEVVEKLIEIGANSSEALSVAAISGNKKLAARVLELGADPHQALYDVEGNTEAGELLIALGADANLALLNFARNHDYYASEKTWKEIQADKLIDVFGADPLLVSMYVEKNTVGYEYLDNKSKDTVRFNIDLAAGSADELSFRPLRMKSIEQFAKGLEFITLSQAREAIERGININLTLLYLARDKDTTMAKYLIDRFGADPTTVAIVAQAGGEEEVATFLRALAE